MTPDSERVSVGVLMRPCGRMLLCVSGTGVVRWSDVLGPSGQLFCFFSEDSPAGPHWLFVARRGAVDETLAYSEVASDPMMGAVYALLSLQGFGDLLAHEIGAAGSRGVMHHHWVCYGEGPGARDRLHALFLSQQAESA